MHHHVKALVVSRDSGICKLIEQSLEAEGHEATCIASPEKALNILGRPEQWDLLLLDAARGIPADELFLPGLLNFFPSEKLCILSEMGETCWRSYAERWKVSKVLRKPLLPRDLEQLISGVSSGERIAMPAPTGGTMPMIEELDNQSFFLASSAKMIQIYRNVRILASVDHPVLILGESGVGKEVIARLLHKYHYARADKKFINVNTAALPSELLESELFGYEAGAFTGAIKAKPGKFELADKGTLLLDEIGEMSPMMQAKLLHVLQDGSFSRLGARCSSQVDVRILAATNVDLEVAITEKRFREDLYYRLNAFTITIPSLRERKEEIPMLVKQMMGRAAARAGQEPVEFSARLIEAAQEYHWPGNLRELRNFVTRMLVLQDQESALTDLQAKIRAKSPEVDLRRQTPVVAAAALSGMKGVVNEQKQQIESRMITEALSASGWNRRRAATNLNISYRALLYKIQQHGLTASSL